MFRFGENKNRAIQISARALGLTDAQISAENFGWHTINIINAELDKNSSLSLEDAFTKYKGLNNFQVKGIAELNLSRDQVTSSNFGSSR